MVQGKPSATRMTTLRLYLMLTSTHTKSWSSLIQTRVINIPSRGRLLAPMLLLLVFLCPPLLFTFPIAPKKQAPSAAQKEDTNMTSIDKSLGMSVDSSEAIPLLPPLSLPPLILLPPAVPTINIHTPLSPPLAPPPQDDIPMFSNIGQDKNSGNAMPGTQIWTWRAIRHLVMISSQSWIN